MAKVKLKLDRRKNCRKKDGTYPIVLVLSHKSKTRIIGLDFSAHPEDWNPNKLELFSVPNHKHITAKIRSQLSRAELFLMNNALSLDQMSINELKARIQVEMKANEGTSLRIKENYVQRRINQSSLIDFANAKLERLKQSNRNGYATAIRTSLTALKRFSGSTDILFTDIDVVYLKNFEAYCKGRGNKPNTISAYLRPIKTLFREAIQEDIIPMELNPFNKYTIPKAKQTKKRALRMSDIQAMRKLELKIGSALWDARNYFLFMFNNMGINLVDVARLRKEQIVGAQYNDDKLVSGRVQYVRSKNGREYSIKLTEEAVSILNAYNIASKELKDKLFPIGFEESVAGFKRYAKQRDRINKRIREIGKMIGLTENITSYYARHSWATIAKRKMVPISVISDGLGHTDLKTTQIYLDSFDDDVLDSANDEIVN